LDELDISTAETGEPMMLQTTQLARPLARGPIVRRRNRRRGGFTLIEASLATVIIGVGFLSTLTLIAAGTRANLQGAEMSTGVNLARSVRELALQKAYTQLPAWNNTRYMPPRDSRDMEITSLPNWEQDIAVVAVDPADVSKEYVDSNPDAVKITVTVKHNSAKVCEMSWYQFNGQHN
jgi:type II secretory pathway pseudopilin PulG